MSFEKIEDNIGYINSSNSNGNIKGFYNIIFTTILGNTSIKEIISDNNMLVNALNSYDKLNSLNNNLNIKVIQNKEYFEFSVDKIKEINARVSIKGNNLNEIFTEHYRKILNIKHSVVPSSYVLEYLNGDISGCLNSFLFGGLEILRIKLRNF